MFVNFSCLGNPKAFLEVWGLTPESVNGLESGATADEKWGSADEKWGSADEKWGSADENVNPGVSASEELVDVSFVTYSGCCKYSMDEFIIKLGVELIFCCWASTEYGTVAALSGDVSDDWVGNGETLLPLGVLNSSKKLVS